MQISTRHGLAFLCMPKCASSSIEIAIRKFCNINISGPPELKHINAQVYYVSILSTHKKLMPAVNLESMCLMRNPMDWIESWYRYRSRDELKDPKHQFHKNYTGKISFQEFVKEYITDGNRKPFARLSKQCNFITLRNGQIGLDHIMTLDRMDQVTNFLSEKFSQNIEIPRINVSPKLAGTLDSKTEEDLRQYLVEDIAIYEFITEHGKFSKALHAEEVLAKRKACR
ncbi:MAG: hypothetical protein ACI8P9_002277 [Parasphingorhabdus sp.]|jgi:hypothetical protein